MQIVPDAPDADIVDPPAASDAPAAPVADPPAADPAGDPPAPAAAADDPPAPAPTPAPKAPATVPLRILQERVGEVTRKKDQDIAERDRKIAEYEAILARVQNGGTAPAAGDPPAPRAAAAPAAGDQSFEDAVNRTVTAREASRSIAAMVTTGRNEFTSADWNEKAEILGAVGAASPEFVMDVIAADPVNAHKIVYALAQDPERAASLANMDIRQRTAELTRMSMAEQAKAPAAAAAPAAAEPPKTQISRAPAPKPPIAPHAPAADIDPTTPEGDAKMSDQQWEKWYKDKYQKRA